MEDGNLWATVIRQMRHAGAQIVAANQTRWHKSPFFIFRRPVYLYDTRIQLEEGFGFVIHGAFNVPPVRTF